MTSTMMKSALQQALMLLVHDCDALLACHQHPETGTIPADDVDAVEAFDEYVRVIALCREALAAPEQKPVAWTDENVIAWCVARGINAAAPAPVAQPVDLVELCPDQECADRRKCTHLAWCMSRAWIKPKPAPAPKAALAPVAPQPRLTVRLRSFPESNGKRNWTALLVRVDEWGGLLGNGGGITIGHGELWNRVAYEAERTKLLIGERETEPFILDYGDDIATPDQWAGEVRGGRPVRGAPKAATAPVAQPLTQAEHDAAIRQIQDAFEDDDAPAPVAQPKPLDDPRLQELFASAITGAIAMGAQGINRPPMGHWLAAAWDMGCATAAAKQTCAKPSHGWADEDCERSQGGAA